MEKVMFCGRPLDHPIMNAAGTCKQIEEVKELAKSAVAAITVGSITKLAREGNPGNTWAHLGHYSLNSLGLPNPGAGYYRQNLPEMSRLAHAAGKLIFVSIAGFSPAEYAELALLAMKGGADFVELNLGCPNVWGSAGQHPIASFNPELILSIICSVSEKIDQFGLKLSPYSDPLALANVADLLSGWSKVVRFVTTANTFPNAFGCNDYGVSSIGVGKGLAGLAGPAMKPIALGQVIQFRSQLNPEIEIIGAGGITSGQDVCHFIGHGTKLVQIGSEFARSHNPHIFSKILADYVDWAIQIGQIEEK